MTVESTLRGAGRNASGSTVAWYRTVEWLMANGPATLDEITAGCAEFVDAGYVRRGYAKHLQSANGPESRRSGPCAPGDLDVARARRWWLQKNLRHGAANGSVVRHGEKWQALRLPRPPAGLRGEQITADPDAQRRSVTEHQLVMALRKARPRLVSNQGKVNRTEKDALLAWLDARDPHKPRDAT